MDETGNCYYNKGFVSSNETLLNSIMFQPRFRMTEAGQKPVLLSREIEGFALNRIQYAILNECWRLIADGVLSVKDIDSVMKDGLGMRYAFLGAMETTHLNAEGN